MLPGAEHLQAQRARASVVRWQHQPDTAHTRQRLAAARRREHAWSTGANGERQVATSLTSLEADGWIVLHDVRWPGRRRANLDHVAIGPGGVVVIDAKNWSGDVSLRDGVLRQNGRVRSREVDSVARAVAAVSTVLGAHVTVRGVLCLVGQEEPPTTTAPGTTVVGLSTLTEAVVGAPALTPKQVKRIAARLRRELDVPTRSRTVVAAVLQALLALVTVMVILLLFRSFLDGLAP